jgi:hypothetical protein
MLFAISLSFYLLDPFGNKCLNGDCKNGYGTYLYSSGLQYNGEWKNGKRHGQGILTYPDGSEYSGGWKNDRMHGQGIKIYNSDRLYRKYTGAWENGNKQGIGTAMYLGGEQYSGDWRNGRMHGQGSYTSVSGLRYVGGWKNNKMYGHGTMTHLDGTKTTGEWFNNRLVGDSNFYPDDFSNSNKSVKALCIAIRADISLSLNAKGNTTEWLNELLKIPRLYEEFNKKILVKRFSREIDVLIEDTKYFRDKNFAELNNDIQKDILKLNRLLIEHFYPHLSPKS